MGNIFIQTDKLLTEEEAEEMWRAKSLVLLKFFASFFPKGEGEVHSTEQILSQECVPLSNRAGMLF